MKFTSETAVIAAKKSHEPTSARITKKAALEAMEIQAQLAAGDEYADKTLVRVRVQLELVNQRLTEQLSKTTLDPQAIDRLASAQSRLSEQERILAGRPTPGALRPTSSRSKDRRSYQKPAMTKTSESVKSATQPTD